MTDRSKFLPIDSSDLKARGWDACDIILLTGDAYVDHPSYGAAMIGRVLEDAGYKVGILAQPDWKKNDDFMKLGQPRLFFGITAGNLDSMVSNYTASKKPRRTDDYSPGGESGFRPNRASIVYSNKVKELFPGVPVVIGGIEASLRRLAHHDYWEESVRRSLLLDAKADILVYGMGERQVVEIANRLATILKPGSRMLEPGFRMRLDGIPGTVIGRSGLDGLEKTVEIPSFEEVRDSKDKFNEAFKLAYLEADPVRGKAIVQKHANRYVIQYPPATPLTTAEMDKIYALPFARDWHPVYDKAGGVPGFETTRFSIISHRGCSGECHFCSLFAHQGRIIQSRSRESILEEVRKLAARQDFKGTITDIGGPTANLYGAECDLWAHEGACKSKHCMMPSKCKNLKLGYAEAIKLWREVMKIPKVKHLFIQSGMRFDLLAEDDSDDYLRELCAGHVSGQLKVAPEHYSDRLLKLMNKPSFKVYEKFAGRFAVFSHKAGKKQYLVNYWISAHPGSGPAEARELAGYLREHHLRPEQVQDFMPLPMTASGCMYWTGKHPFTGEAVVTAKTYKEREAQRLMVQPQSEPRARGHAPRKKSSGKSWPVAREE